MNVLTHKKVQLSAARNRQLHYDTIFEGHNSLLGFLNMASQLDIARAVMGEPATPELWNRLQSL